MNHVDWWVLPSFWQKVKLKGQTKFESICQEIRVGQVLFGDLMTICFVVYFIHSESSNRWVPSQAPRHTRKSRWDFLKPSCAGESPVQTWVGTGHFTNLSVNKTRTESWWLKKMDIEIVPKVQSGYMLYKYCGWWFLSNPFEKYARQNGFIFPNFRGDNKT